MRTVIANIPFQQSKSSTGRTGIKKTSSNQYGVKRSAFRLGTADCFAALAMTILLLFTSACHPTYKQETIKESVKALAKKEYRLDVDVAQEGKTLGARFSVPNLLSEMYSGDDDIYRKMNGLFTILARVALSSDIAPEFIVLDIMDESNPHFRLVFTRYVDDVRKSAADALSYPQMQDRLLQEFVVNGKRITFDPADMGLARFMMMAIDTPTDAPKVTEFVLKDISVDGFLARVIENTLRRLLRENKEINEELQARDVAASFGSSDRKGEFKVRLDLASRSAVRVTPQFLEGRVLPFVAKEVGSIFKSYRFTQFSNITVVEKNSGKTLTVAVH